MFTFQGIIPPSGIWKQGNFGGLTETAQNQMPGYMARQRFGYVEFAGENLSGCVGRVVGYQQHTISDFELPGRVLIELPCEVAIIGAPGTAFIILGRDVDAYPDRGARATLFAPGSPADSLSGPVPPWASSFDASGDGGTFFSDAGFTSPVGSFISGATGVSIPSGARFVRMPATGTSSNPKTLTFRQLP